MILINQLYDALPIRTQAAIDDIICDQVETGGHLFMTPSHFAYALKILARSASARSESVVSLASRHESPIVRTAAMTALIKRGVWMSLSDLKNNFSNMSPIERRLTIVASYVLGDEGSHWRGRIKRGADQFEKFTIQWMASRNGQVAGIS